jgi:hypothetical protein
MEGLVLSQKAEEKRVSHGWNTDETLIKAKDLEGGG